MYVIIIGSGNLGVGLALALSSRKDDVVVVDHGADSGRFGEGFDGMLVDGDPMDMKVLELSGMPRADLVIAVTSSDNVNVTCVQAAKELFGVKKVLARIADPEREKFYRSIGLGTVCPTVTGVNQVLELVLADRFAPFAASLDPSMLCVHTLPEWVGLSFSKIVPREGGHIVGVMRGGRLARVVRREVVRSEDTVVIALKAEKGGRSWSV
ncbi:MAG: NAD-binding protein [Rectinemataceae bacterium]